MKEVAIFLTGITLKEVDHFKFLDGQLSKCTIEYGEKAQKLKTKIGNGHDLYMLSSRTWNCSQK